MLLDYIDISYIYNIAFAAILYEIKGALFGEFEFQNHSNILQTLVFTLGVNPSGITKNLTEM